MESFRTLLAGHWQIIIILVAACLITVSTGTYTNWDAQLEFEAASNVVTRGFPIVTTGLMINQPPLGFYMAAPVFHVFGLSYLNGVTVVTVFGLGCTALVYALGLLLYGKNTGLAAAALFALAPWHVYLSRIFLIDNQSLFFGLLAVVVGVLAVKRNSNRLVLTSGVMFALAFMTKLFAVFMLVPLALIVFFQRKEGKFQLTAKKALLFVAPSAVLQAVWYGGIANQNFFAVYFSSDFTHPELVADPSLTFWPVVVVKSAGWFLLLAAVLALALPLMFRRVFAGKFWVDAVCVVTVGVVAALNMLLVLGFHLMVPYISVVKYTYAALPFFCLLAASLTDKGAKLLQQTKLRTLGGGVKFGLAGLGVGLLLASLVENFKFLSSWWGFVSFGVDSVMYYPFDVYMLPVKSTFDLFHYAGFTLVLACLILPPIIKGIRKPAGWLKQVLSS